MTTALPAGSEDRVTDSRRSKFVLFISVLLLLAAVLFDLLLQAPLAGLTVSAVALLWTVAALLVGVVKRQGIFVTLAKHKASALLVGTYFASLGSGLLVSRLVLNEAQVLRVHLLQSKAEGNDNKPLDQQAAYASFCASRINKRCGWLNYRIYFSPDSMPPGANLPGTLVANQFFTERVSIALESGEVLERRSVD
ncbi:MAG: hypothetical protein ACK5OA_05680 [Acidovorax sp.]|jgi:hypothetical protein